MDEVAETRYAPTPHGRIAYQSVGNGPVDILAAKLHALPIDLMWDEPRFARFLNRLSGFSRHIWFDQRGSGASDPLPRVVGRLAEDLVEDMLAVIDHLQCEQVVLLGAPGPLFLLAATHPERVRGIVLINPSAVPPPGIMSYPESAAEELDTATLIAHTERSADVVRDRWGTGSILTVSAPSVAEDPAFRRWYSRCERLACSPEEAYWRFRANAEMDLRAVLPAVKVPTLVLFRPDSTTGRQSRYVAEHIAGAKAVELPGEDFIFFVGDTSRMLDEIERFVTGRLPTPVIDRVLATVVFTDVVGSTEEAVRLGDRRWRELLAEHDALVRRELDRHQGREVKSMGDGFLATFDGPGRAVRFGSAVRDAVQALGLDVRIGIHTGEIERNDDDISGIAVHIGQRVEAQARPGEVLVSRTVVDLVAGSGIRFAERGEHELKGVPGTWQLFAVQESPPG